LFLGLSHTGAWDPNLLRPVEQQGVERDLIEWEVHKVPKERFAISLPRGWNTVTRNPIGREELARLRKENPKLAGFFADAVVFRNPKVRFRAFDARPEVRAAAGRELFVSGMNRYKVLVRRPSVLPIVLSFRQYSVVAGPKEYVLTFVTTQRQARSYAPTFRKSASTFRLF
jgi:hypothetical protein